jgi:hypothetical protein
VTAGIQAMVARGGASPIVIAAAAPNNASVFRTGAVCTGTITVNTSGTMTWTKVGTYLTTPTSSKDWFNPSGGTPGNSYWVKGTNTGDVGAFSNTGVVLALSTNRAFGVSSPAGGPQVFGGLRLDIYSDAGGTNLVGSGTFTIDVDGT